LDALRESCRVNESRLVSKEGRVACWEARDRTRADLEAAIAEVVAERDALREIRERHISDMAAVADRHLDAVVERDAATKRADGLAAELAKLHARIEQSHNGYGETGKALGMERPASHLIALGELLTEQVELADSVMRMERDEARAQLAAAQAKMAAIVDWCHQAGRNLVPRPGCSDSFGDGIRQAQRTVSNILNGNGHGGPFAAAEQGGA
jgi:hypothetical protein